METKDPKKNYKFGWKTVECKHEFTQDFTYGRKTPDPITHIYCVECGWHKFRGVEYTNAQWKKWLNSPNLADPEYDNFLRETECATVID